MQQLGIRESPKLAEGSEITLHLWACEHPCSREAPAGSVNSTFQLCAYAHLCTGFLGKKLRGWVLRSYTPALVWTPTSGGLGLHLLQFIKRCLIEILKWSLEWGAPSHLKNTAPPLKAGSVSWIDPMWGGGLCPGTPVLPVLPSKQDSWRSALSVQHKNM